MYHIYLYVHKETIFWMAKKINFLRLFHTIKLILSKFKLVEFFNYYLYIVSIN
jgi:hypothetical protein